jgi:hypothetical protein
MPDSPVSLTTLLSEHRMCIACLADRVGDSSDIIEMSLAVIGRTLRLRRQARACPFCGVPGTVYGLDTPKAAGHRQ